MSLAAESLGPTPDAWEDYLAARFPGYLLPSAAHSAVSRDAALHFLRHFAADGADELELGCTASLVTDPVKRLVLDRLVADLPALLRRLPSTALVERRTWHGGFQGRVDVAQTLALRARGERLTYITSARRRSFALPETELLAATLRRLRDRLRVLQHRGLLKASAEARWSAGLDATLAAIERALDRSPLGILESTTVDSHHERAARESRDGIYRRAAEWHHWLRAIDESDDARAEHIARGGLLPMDAETRFHVAVLVRLAEGFERVLVPAGWRMELCAVVTGRRDIVAFHRADGARIAVHHDQAILPFGDGLGDRDRGVAHYLASSGRLRPDITVTLESPANGRSGFVVEVKCSASPSYIATGYGEAVLYRNEYRGDLRGMPKSALVAPNGVTGNVRDEDEVIAVGWLNWPPPRVIERLVAWVG